MDLHVRCLHSLAEIAHLAARIDALNRDSTLPSPFATFEHLENAILRGPFSRHAPAAHIWFLAAFDEETLVGFLALQLTRERYLGMRARRLGFLTGVEYDRPGVVAPAGRLESVARAIYGHLNDRRAEWDYLEFEKQPMPSTLHPLPSGVRMRGCAVREFPNWDNCTIPIRWNSVAEYLGAMDRKFATNVKRQMRKLHASGSLEVLASSDPASTPALLSLFCDVERRSWKAGLDTAVGTDPALRDYYRDLLDPRQPLRIAILLLILDGVPIAGFVTGTFDTGTGTDAHGLHIVYDRAYHAMAPGSAIMLLAVRRAIEERCASLNLLTGFSYYKRQWLADTIPTRTVQLYRLGRLPHVRRMLGDLRRALWRKQDAGGERFNPAKRDANVDAPQPRAERETIAALLAEARRGRCESLSPQQLEKELPFLSARTTSAR